MSVVRRRTAGKDSAEESPSCASIVPPHQLLKQKRRHFQIFLLLSVASVALSLAFHFYRSRFISADHRLKSGAIPEDEDALSLKRLSIEDYTPETFRARGVACMPSVTRMRNGSHVEYVSNAVKSWRLATKESEDLRDLTVFDMDKAPRAHPEWLKQVFSSEVKTLPNWLKHEKREGKVRTPRKLTLGDSRERVEWRSKEAMDYAEVLNRCASSAPADVEYVIIVQDDVLFGLQMRNVLQWCDEHMKSKLVTNEKGTTRMVRVCGASLFDLAKDEAEDGHKLRSSNMVARVWKRESVESMVKYLRYNFDEAPVDWLADRRCRSQRGQTFVMEPNPVRHRGAVSSFMQNEREGTLT